MRAAMRVKAHESTHKARRLLRGEDRPQMVITAAAVIQKAGEDPPLSMNNIKRR
jgi:hypothetical protein